MKQMRYWIVWIAMAFVVQSCEKLVGEGPVVTETRVTPHFTGIELKVPGKLYYTEGASYQVEVSAQKNILDEIETIMSGHDLVIRFRHDNTQVKASRDITVRVTAPAINKLEVHGSGEIESNTAFNTPALRLGVSGSGNIRVVETETALLDAAITGSGRITMIEGIADRQTLEISGNGLMDFGNFISKKASAHISGSGSIKLNVAETLDASISGSGSILYRGNPAVTSSVSGSGKVARQ